MTKSDLPFQNGFCLLCRELIVQVVGKGNDIGLASQAGSVLIKDGLSNAMATMFHVLLFCHTLSPLSGKLLGLGVRQKRLQ